MKKKIALFTILGAMVIGMVGCAGRDKCSDYVATEAEENVYMDYATGSYIAEDYATSNASDNTPYCPVGEPETKLQQVKLIKSYDYDICADDFEKSSALLKDVVKKYSGYFEDMYVSEYGLMNGTFTVRIPSEKVDDFLAEMDSLGEVISEREYVENVSSEYMDVNAHIEALQKQHDRLLALMDSAEDISDIITIEERLTGIEYQLGSLESQMSHMNNSVEYASVYINMSERIETQIENTDSVWERIVTGLAESNVNVVNGFVDLLVFLIIALPYIAVTGIISLIVFFTVKKVKNKKNSKKSEVKTEE